MNEAWKGIEKRVQHMELHELPVLGDPAKEEGDFIGWIVRISFPLGNGIKRLRREIRNE